MLLWFTNASWGAPAPDFEVVDGVFHKYCLDCHAASDPEKNLVLEDFASTMKGGEAGAAILPGKSSESLLVKFLEGQAGKTGKNQFMPPGKRKHLDADEIAAIKAWIDAGATPPKEAPKVASMLLNLPKVVPKGPLRHAIHALATSRKGDLAAVGRYAEVELISTETRATLNTFAGHRGHVNALAFSADGKFLAAAAGEAGMFGEVRIWNLATGKLERLIEGHKDALYSVAISPDGKTLATGSYDQKVKLWEMETGKELRTLTAHNGAIFGLAFRPDGKVLASASGDRTVKLWEVATGKRLDTLSQSLKDLYAVAFSPDGHHLVAGGADNRIRIWEISSSALDGTDPLIESRFAHEGAIMSLAFSADGRLLISSAEDRTIKVWDGQQITEKLVLEPQSDLAPGIAFGERAATIIVGRLDGTLGYYQTSSGQPIAIAAHAAIK